MYLFNEEVLLALIIKVFSLSKLIVISSNIGVPIVYIFCPGVTG